MNVLVIYEENPERIRTEVLEDPSDGVIAILRASHGKYVNSDEWPEADQMSVLAESFALAELGEPLAGPFDLVIITGFIM